MTQRSYMMSDFEAYTQSFAHCYTLSWIFQGQGILTTDEVEQFCEFVKKPMPWTFRISNLGR